MDVGYEGERRDHEIECAELRRQLRETERQPLREQLVAAQRRVDALEKENEHLREVRLPKRPSDITGRCAPQRRRPLTPAGPLCWPPEQAARQSEEGLRAAIESNDELRALHGLSTQVQDARVHTHARIRTCPSHPKSASHPRSLRRPRP